MFSDRVSTRSFLGEFAREGNGLTFSGPDGKGGATGWQIRIDSSLAEPNELNEAMPCQGRITLEWTVNGEVVEYLGNITVLPIEFLDRGLEQECWAYWVVAEGRWKW